MGMLLDFFPLLIQRCAALLRVREKKMSSSIEDADVRVLKEAQANRLKVPEVQQKLSVERLESSKVAHLVAKEHKEAKLAEKEAKTLEVKAKMMETYNCLLVKDNVLMTDEEKVDHVGTLKYLKKTLFPDMY